MITTVTGKVGSGKTYWAVNYLVKKFFRFDDEILTWATAGAVRVVTNIDSLKLPHIDFEDEVRRLTLQRVFSKEYVQGFKGTTVFIIDEAQYVFDRNFKDKEVMLFLQMSRHYGCDVILITQDLASLCVPVRVLCEYEVYAVERSVRFGKVLMYRYKLGEEVFKRQQIKFSMQVAGLYRSFMSEETIKPKSALFKYAGYAGALIAVVVLMMYFTISNLYGTKEPKKGVARAAVAPATRPQAALQEPVPEKVVKEVRRLNKELEQEEEKKEVAEEKKDLREYKLVRKNIENGVEGELYEDGKKTGWVRVIRE